MDTGWQPNPTGPGPQWPPTPTATLKGHFQAPRRGDRLPGFVPGAPGLVPGPPGLVPGPPGLVPGPPGLVPGPPAFIPGTPVFTPGTPGFVPGSPGPVPGFPALIPGAPGPTPRVPLPGAAVPGFVPRFASERRGRGALACQPPLAVESRQHERRPVELMRVRSNRFARALLRVAATA